MALFGNKKAQFIVTLLMIFIVVACVLAAAIAMIIGYKIWQRIDSSGAFSDNAEANSSMQITGKSLLSWDNFIMMIFVIFSVGVVISASQITSSPSWFFILLAILAALFVVGVIMSNAYERMADSASISETADNFVKTRFLFDNLPIYLIVMGFAVMISMYVGVRLG